MTTDYIIDKYNNLNVEEEFINNYLYKPINIKYSEVIQFKKPKKFFVNKRIENFRTNKKGNLKTLREFQNLYIHKFIIKPKPEKMHKINFELTTKKEGKKNKHKKNNKFIINNDINNDKQRPFSHDSLKRANLLLNSFSKKNSSYFIRKKNNQLNKNKKRIFFSSIRNQINNDINNNSNITNNILKNARSFSTIPLSYEKSKLSLIKELAGKALNKNENNKNEYQKDLNLLSLKRNDSFYLDEPQNSRYLNNKKEKNKYFDTIDKYKENFIKNNRIKNVKYIEITRNYCDFSDAYVIKRQESPYSKKRVKVQKRPKIPLRLFSSDIRQMSALEKYYLKFGVFPYY